MATGAKTYPSDPLGFSLVHISGHDFKEPKKSMAGEAQATEAILPTSHEALFHLSNHYPPWSSSMLLSRFKLLLPLSGRSTSAKASRHF